ncbi:holin [Halobacillus sp. A5]|uniref:holin n=1 Tax=Halobacillus sp. A5 TaxID=2880263 RepID=UPI0020A6CF22|nr:holin [Halobacillus sp. A5]MCP3025429.1 holin [Halobacillus sp. A5]
METVLLFASVILPIVSALIQVMKKSVNLPKNYLPLISIVIGLLVGGLAFPFTDLDLTMRLWAGLFAGLSNVGVFELVKKREGSTKDSDK